MKKDLLDCVRHGKQWTGTLDEGLYEIIYGFEAPDFEADSLYFEFMGRRTGPWDYAPSFAKNRGECLLPHVELEITSALKRKSRVFIPRKTELDKKYFNGRIGFYLDSRKTVTLKLSSSVKNAKWTNVRIERFADFMADYTEKDFKAGQKFWLDKTRIDSIRRNWSSSEWAASLDKTLDDCAGAPPPKNVEEAKVVSGTTSRTGKRYEDSVIFPGNYMSALSLRLLVRPSETDLEQLKRWIDAFADLPYWGFSEDPVGADHDNDLTADFNMLGLAVALSWHREKLGKERAARMEEKIAYQAEQMLKWIIHSRSSWPGVTAQNHAFFGNQTLILAGLLLLGRNKRAIFWLNVGIAAFKRFIDALPPDGSYHEGNGYTAFGMVGLMPSLMLLQQSTGEKFIPDEWLEKHWRFVDTLLPENTEEGFSTDDGTGQPGYLPSLAMWDYCRHSATSDVRRLTGRILYKFFKYNPDHFNYHCILVNFLNMIWAPELNPSDFKPGKASESSSSYFDDCGYFVMNLDPKAKTYFLTGPPQGYKLFEKDQHTYNYGHHHPDAGNILFNYDGKWTLADTGYTWCKLSGEHNVLLVDGQGQHNDGHVWMAPPPFDIKPPQLKIFKTKGLDRAEIDLACYYPSSLGLKSWKRTVCGIRGKGFAVMDDVKCKSDRRLTLSWGSDFPWKKITNGRIPAFENRSGCKILFYGKKEIISIEKCIPVKKYIEVLKDGKPWHALRVNTAEKSKDHRFVTVFRLPGTDAEFDRKILEKLTEK
ncbi:MAG TPA: hypothetical protein DCZ94_02165 [Lentisphaeria bacterium]|nr:MAG: hypothetical protein A2X48_19925 [Lentisphaerae bacterium GWF2_49_21]HBC85739.1 hypothetical protein [Lentisphaeria bacterium]